MQGCTSRLALQAAATASDGASLLSGLREESRALGSAWKLYYSEAGLTIIGRATTSRVWVVGHCAVWRCVVVASAPEASIFVPGHPLR